MTSYDVIAPVTKPGSPDGADGRRWWNCVPVAGRFTLLGQAITDSMRMFVAQSAAEESPAAEELS